MRESRNKHELPCIQHHYTNVVKKTLGNFRNDFFNIPEVLSPIIPKARLVYKIVVFIVISSVRIKPIPDDESSPTVVAISLKLSRQCLIFLKSRLTWNRTRTYSFHSTRANT